jgi:hypothetical protein
MWLAQLKPLKGFHSLSMSLIRRMPTSGSKVASVGFEGGQRRTKVAKRLAGALQILVRLVNPVAQPYQFKPSDNGSHTFTANLLTQSSQTITIADKKNPQIHGIVTVFVNPPPPP